MKSWRNEICSRILQRWRRRYRSIGNCKSSIVHGNEVRLPRRRGGKLSGFHLTSRIWFQISLASLPIEKQSALIATIGWLKTHYPSFRIIDPVSNIHRSEARKLSYGGTRVWLSWKHDSFRRWIRQPAITCLRTCLNNNLWRFRRTRKFLHQLIKVNNYSQSNIVSVKSFGQTW